VGAWFRNPDNLVFTQENGDPWDPHYLYHRFVATVEKLGLRMVPLHMLRHIAASLLILAGMDIAVVSKILGHSKIDLTSDTYGHLIGRVAKRAATKAAKQVPRGAAALEAFERSKGETKEKGKEAKAKKKERKNGRSQDPFS
jgi:integrase